ncbi:hypothetical protein [Sphingobium sp. SCG-1]|uniref:hypothetical protein n=1 Tax=Sphingobium sp. SCG-1 TaxID=2072936 RepID=UPI001CB8B588|nr:hypothetical protein [Sphingobium sp. SCG-1]
MQRDGNRHSYGRDNEQRDRPAPLPQREAVQAEAPAAPQDAAIAPREEATPPRRGRGRPPRDRSLAPVEATPAVEVETPVSTAETEQAAPPRRVGRPRRVREEAVDRDEPTGLDLAVLPPAIARADNDSDAAPAAEETPRKRTRRARPATTEAAE